MNLHLQSRLKSLFYLKAMIQFISYEGYKVTRASFRELDTKTSNVT
jgi:hypothetical protein